MANRGRTLCRKLCYGCLGNTFKEHSENCYASRRMWKVRSSIHLIILYGSKSQKYKKRLKEDTDTEENKPEGVKCTSNSSGSNVINIYIVSAKIELEDTTKTLHTYTLLESWSQGTFILDQKTNDLIIFKRNTSHTIKIMNWDFRINSTALKLPVSVKITMDLFK